MAPPADEVEALRREGHLIAYLRGEPDELPAGELCISHPRLSHPASWEMVMSCDAVSLHM